MELLSPAKDIECGIAAVNSGADAVYIGPENFSARSRAANSLGDIETLVNHAHAYYVKVYAAVNTLLFDDEIPQAVELIHRLYNIGVDAVIIQDTGLLECELPAMPIIASTQMHNDDPQKVAFLEKIGITRVILARELDLGQIRQIRAAAPNIELEFFVHGAICVSYSGQCYLSCAIGNRSANRGQCAQPCRKPYSLYDKQNQPLLQDKYLLSLKDLNLSGHLQDLKDAGINSIKIEGRLKDKTYVTNVTAHYRRLLDGMGGRKKSSGTIFMDFEPDVNKTFNRGFTSHFLNGRSQKVGAINTPKMLGEKLGGITKISHGKITIDTSIEMHCGDGLAFFDENGCLCGTTVNHVNMNTIIPAKPDEMTEGMTVFRNHDHKFLMRLSKSAAQRKINVDLVLTDFNDGFTLQATDEDKNIAKFSIFCELQPAENKNLAIENIQKQLRKTGGTIFECCLAEIKTSDTFFIPVSSINELRRGVLQQLVKTRKENYKRPTAAFAANDTPYPHKELSFEGNVINEKAKRFYARHGVVKIDPGVETGLDMKNKKVMTTRYCVRHQLEICPRRNLTIKRADDLVLVNENSDTLKLTFDCATCRMSVYLQ